MNIFNRRTGVCAISNKRWLWNAGGVRRELRRADCADAGPVVMSLYYPCNGEACRAATVQLFLYALNRWRIQGRIVDAEAITALALGAVHGRVRTLDQFAAVGAVLGEEGDADAR